MNSPDDSRIHSGLVGPIRGRTLAFALLVVTIALILSTIVLFWPDRESDPTELHNEPDSPAERMAEPQQAAESARPEVTAATGSPVASPPPRETARSGTPTSDTPTGIHAFPPLGTRPQLTGVIVPDDFELPPGYVRHYQSTDHGQRLPPILMFDPRNPPLDEFGEPLDIPPDRVVPPEMVPAGLPIEILEIPEQRQPNQRSLRGLLGSD